MENKPQSVFDKLDKQGEQIEDISQRLEGISIENLYALAKRTWDYEDYQTAQKYYNHISLLRPLDWEAPLYASLCKFKGVHKVDFWEYGLDQSSKVIISTINYINKIECSLKEKNNEMNRCLKIINNFMSGLKKMYFENKDVFDKYIPGFPSRLESFFLNVYQNTLTIELDDLVLFRIFISNECLDIIQSTKEISSDISKDVYINLIELADRKFDINYDEIINSQMESSKEMSIEEKKEIMLKGTMYFEFKDKFVSQKLFIRNLVFGMIILLISVGGIIFSLFVNWYLLFAFVLPVFIGIVLIIKAFSQKKRIKCVSLLNSNREKNSLTSNGDIVKKSRTNVLRIISIIYINVGVFVSTFSIVAAFTVINIGNTLLSIVYMLFNIINFLCFVLNYKGLNYYYFSNEGYYTYLYNGKYYEF